jgi:hypothetical protein
VLDKQGDAQAWADAMLSADLRKKRVAIDPAFCRVSWTRASRRRAPDPGRGFRVAAAMAEGFAVMGDVGSCVDPTPGHARLPCWPAAMAHGSPAQAPDGPALEPHMQKKRFFAEVRGVDMKKERRIR